MYVYSTCVLNEVHRLKNVNVNNISTIVWIKVELVIRFGSLTEDAVPTRCWLSHTNIAIICFTPKCWSQDVLKFYYVCFIYEWAVATQQDCR